MSNVVLGVTGSVAAYRAADVARELMRTGFKVRTCLTRGAEQFVTAPLFEALTGNPCLTHAFDEPIAGEMAHIVWSREADLILICPCTANALAALAHGQAVDMLTTIALASSAPLVLAPAMNPTMFESEAVQSNLRSLQQRGAEVVMPIEGDVACGEFGQGKLASVKSILEACETAAFRSSLFEGVRVLVTAGPTREPLDPVRFISNRSSGKMGYAIAKCLRQAGAKVTLISGPTNLVPPANVKFVSVQTADEMASACANESPGCQLAICAAAVADFKLSSVPTEKMKKAESLKLEFVTTPDVISSIQKSNPEIKIVGFAAETHHHEAYAQRKLQEKRLHAIAMNRVDRTDIAFDSPENELELLFSNGDQITIKKNTKFVVARKLLEAVRRSMT